MVALTQSYKPMVWTTKHPKQTREVGRRGRARGNSSRQTVQGPHSAQSSGLPWASPVIPRRSSPHLGRVVASFREPLGRPRGPSACLGSVTGLVASKCETQPFCPEQDVRLHPIPREVLASWDSGQHPGKYTGRQPQPWHTQSCFHTKPNHLWRGMNMRGHCRCGGNASKHLLSWGRPCAHTHR